MGINYAILGGEAFRRGFPKKWRLTQKTVATHNPRQLQYLQQYIKIILSSTNHPAEDKDNLFHFSPFLKPFFHPPCRCQDLLVQLLKERLATCRRAPQWPVVNNLRQSSSTTVHKTFEQFQRDVGGVEPVSTEDLRAGSTLQEDMKTTNDLFVYFGSTLAGKRRVCAFLFFETTALQRL